LADQADPGGRLTGISSVSVLVTAKRLQLLKEMVPTVNRSPWIGRVAE
jgi:hypothetical protein